MADIPDFETYKLNKQQDTATIPSFDDYKKSKDDTVTITPFKHGGIKRPNPVTITKDQADHTFREFPGKQIVNVLPAVGGGLGAAFGGGIPGAAAGGGFGSALGTLLQNELPSLFGNVPEQDSAELGLKFLKDAGINGVLEGGSQALGAGYKVLASKILASKPVSALSTTVKTAREAERVNDLASQADYLIHTPQAGTELGNTQISNLFSKGYSPSSGALNPTKILDELHYNPEKYGYIDPDVKQRTVDFLTAAKDSKPFIDKSDNPTVLRYLKGKIALGIGASIGGALGGAPGAAVAGGSILLGGKAIEKAVADPEINRLMLQAFKTGVKSPEASVLNKVITNSLRGTSVIWQGDDGSQEPAQISQDGQVQLLPPHR